MRRVAAGVLLAAWLVAPVSAHRLDEYLQATLLGVTRQGVEVELQLTPGVAVLPSVVAVIDRNLDGQISPDEERAYSAWVLKDLDLKIDGRSVPLRIVESQYPSLQDMHEGLGSIRLKMKADCAGHELRFENRHLPELSVYLVNCLADSGAGLTVGKQERDEAQKSIRFVYSFVGDTAVASTWLAWFGGVVVLAAGGMVLYRYRRSPLPKL